ncbi:RagB/SusD family nutrient uptake outer membrane protein [Faecalibacter rhinopitheci]|uniref:RagB/SusD family nutrient uptake outer membrane protein n=1 Tax=Faecalibacter rhinopitheci TaxID=2779678 RepID=A0A8J7FTM6_9FLAO|nr:RagB/SusD family nutrient uptake outer membrane protein [Faecalibacter rhinopitheci]MBF0597552.1 RagB/SusD family nutrient uptake outer membrane protein [Faecalibacter rhinopitheci]
MKKNKITKYILAAAVAFSISSCHDDLDLMPNDPDVYTEFDVFSNAEQAKLALAKVYASLALTGQKGPSDMPDIEGIDEGASQYTRLLFNLNVITTDESVIGWGDPGMPNLHAMSWGASNSFVQAMYYRLAQTVTFSNSYIQNAQKLVDSNPELKTYIAEARFIRAYAYYNLMDMYANVPLVTEISSETPKQSNRQEIFAFVESELLDIQNSLSDTKIEYGRVDKVASYALLSRLYLNAETWINQPKYTEAITYSNLAIQSHYSIHTNDVNENGSAYDELFLADNDSNGAQNEFIFALNFDGNNSKTYGGSTFIVKSSIGGSMKPADSGVNGGWGGPRTTKSLVSKFESSQNNNDGNPIAWKDKRAMFFTDGQSYEISNISQFGEGYAVTKFSNKKSNGTNGNDATGEFVDTDIPVIRLAEMYLNYAEAVIRGGAGGDRGTAVNYINALRERGYGNNSGNITTAQLDLDFILDERARELYWEGTRRTDLIRFNKFTTGTYLWPYKGDAPNGTSVSDTKNIFPIPTNIIVINPNLTQNPGY